ncbi:MAG: hypothetical protein KF795_33575 [Labilithrix sp.]|nr:hypothetical protein [Labilithrix sp.]
MTVLLGSVGAPGAIATAAPPATKPPASRPAKPAGKPAPAPPVKRAPPPLAILPSVARVKITSHGKVLSVLEEVNLPRGEWKGEALRFHVAFGAPGPRAIDARLVALGDGELEPPDDDDGEALATERVHRRPEDAYALLGRETMAGIVVTLGADALARALSRGNMASLRIRSLVDTIEDASGASTLVVRLGASRGTPLTLGRIVAASATPSRPLARVEARLCGPDADPHPLAVAMIPRPSDAERQTTIAPVLSVRHATDDLCVRLWHAAKR